MTDLNWQRDIEPYLQSLIPTKGGFTAAIKGTITLADGRSVFVKIAQTDQERAWINKEIAVYEWLNQKNYKYAPWLLCFKDGGLVIDDLSNYDWSESWTVQKVQVVLDAMDSLAALSTEVTDTKIFTPSLSERNNGWAGLLKNQQNVDKAEALDQKLTLENIQMYLNQTKNISIHGNTLVHLDIRADNFAYDSKQNSGYLIDWNWAELGNEAIDKVAFLISVEQQGFAAFKTFSNLLDPVAMLWLAGFWLNNGLQPPPRDDDNARLLRQKQIKSGLLALNF